MQKTVKEKRNIRRKLKQLQKCANIRGIDWVVIEQLSYICNYEKEKANKGSYRKDMAFILLSCLIIIMLSVSFYNSIISARCLLPSNYLVWEATRPLADCGYCADVTKPIVLRNITRRDFKNYAYSSRPIIVKNAINHWRAVKEFNFNFFKKLYEETVGSYESVDEGCQFLNFKTDIYTLQEVFNMPEARVKNEPGQSPWYVGWGNCHPNILKKVRQYYTSPDFLPKDAEFPSTENIFLGYEIGAVMHLDYISRLMWQGQVAGNKTWTVAPVPECDHVCHKFEYFVEPGDVVLLDTRVWYHATKIPKGQLSITVQSEYG